MPAPSCLSAPGLAWPMAMGTSVSSSANALCSMMASCVTSSYPPLRLLGLVSTVAIVALGAASLFVLPALLLKPRR